jgi:hypothetical protein
VNPAGTCAGPGAELSRLYGLWRDLTVAESRAIEAEAWEGLVQLHRQKADLKTAIVEVCSGGFKLSEALHSFIDQLLQLEHENLVRLEQRLVSVRGELADIDDGWRNLRRVHRSYRGRVGHPAAFRGTA